MLAISLVLALIALAVHSVPLSSRDVIAPKITSPTKDSVWPVGSVQTVTWDTSNFPPDSQITNPIGKVLLGFDANDSLNLDIDHPLAQGFKLRDGSVQVTVPNVPPKDNYLIVLMGDSGNSSPTFAITRITNGTSLSSSASSSSSSSSPASPAMPSASTNNVPAVPSPPPANVGATSSPALVNTPIDTQTTPTTPTSSASQTSPSTTTPAVASNVSTGAASSIRLAGFFGFPSLCIGAVSLTLLLTF